MYCARCRRTFGLYEKVTWTVLPGSNKKLPTCYWDRFCYPFNIKQVVALPALVVTVKPVIRRKKNKNRNISKEMSKEYVRPWK